MTGRVKNAFGTYDADGVDPAEPAARALLGLGLDELVEALAAVFFHALEAETHVDGELKAEGLVSLENVKPAENWALVVR